MINLLESKKNKLHFQINKANIINQNLGIKPDIILLGGTDIDVAKLYRQVQSSLDSQEEKVKALETKRVALEKNIALASDETRQLESKLGQQLKLLNQQKLELKTKELMIRDKESEVIVKQERLNQMETTTNEQQGIIDEQRKNVIIGRENYNRLAEKSQQQQATISQQKKVVLQERLKFESLTLNIKEREEALDIQATQIRKRSQILSQQDEKIADQELILSSQSETITTQRSFLAVISIAAVLLVLLASAIYRNNRQKLKLNKRLLEQKIIQERITEDLAQAVHAAKVANHAKSTFLANMSHELRTPLNAVLGFSRLMQDDPLTPETQQESLDIINRSGTHLLELINDVLDMSKVEAGQLKLDCTDYDLGALVRDVMDMMRVRADDKGIQLLLDQSSDFPRFINGDAAKLRQILINLLSNSIKFTDVGGVSLRLSSNKQQQDQLVLRIEVEDSGCGIPAAVIDKIFVPFPSFAKTAPEANLTAALPAFFALKVILIICPAVPV